jgi:hypothetical protein
MKEYTGYPRALSPIREHYEARGEAISDRRAFDRGEARHEAEAHTASSNEEARVARLAAASALIAALEAEG